MKIWSYLFIITNAVADSTGILKRGKPDGVKRRYCEVKRTYQEAP
jgi:hypothetical protein